MKGCKKVRCALHPSPDKLTIAITRGFAILSSPLQDAEWSAGKGKTALISALVWVWNGHNNIKLNPVFRGMVRCRRAGRIFNQRKIVLSIGIKELLESGVHFGHQTRRWNPKMKPFIFDARNGIHIIDLSQTLTQLEAACDFLSETVRKGGKVVFVGTKKQAQQCVKDTAKECGQFFVTERWLGGTLTNYNTIKSSIKRLKEIEKMETDGSLANYGKQEQAVIRREAGRLHKYFDGIRAMDKIPAAMFVVDIKREHNAVAEARKLKLPLVAVVDTN